MDYQTTKRWFDVALSGAALIVLAPLMGAIALGVRLTSDGPAVYRGTRLGRSGETFEMLKFRTMRTDAADIRNPDGSTYSRADDPRVTPIGRWLRRTSLDELPQLWNVLRGDMSFVGPRPERPFFVEELSKAVPFYQQRHVVKPGITGWAQVRYRYGASIDDATEKLRYDLYYIKHLSIFFDLTIVFDTVKVVLFRKGAA